MLCSRQWKRILWLVQTISFFLSSGKVFINKSFIPAIGEEFSLQWKQSTLLESSFLLAEAVNDMSRNHFLKIDLILAGGNSFSSQWETFSSIASDIFRKFFIPARGKTFFSPEEKVLFFTQNFLSCQWKPLFKLQRSLFKTLTTATGNDFP